MDDPYLYHNGNKYQNSVAAEMIPRYINLIQLRDTDLLTVIDIGCANGDVTWNYLRTHLPTGTKIVGSDIQPKMLEYVKEHYPEIQCVHLDIGASEIPKFMITEYDHTFSFFCFHLIREPKQAFNNMYRMLKPGGSIFTYYPTSHLFLDICHRSLQLENWKTYFSADMKNAKPNHLNHLHPLEREQYIKDILDEIGFEIILCKSVPHQYTYKNIKDLRDGLTSIHPYYNNIPHDLRKMFMDDVIEEVKLHKDIQYMDKSEGILINHFLIVIIAMKPLT